MKKKVAKSSARKAQKKTPVTVAAKRKLRLPDKYFPIVGIGASAGGLEASLELLKYTRADLGMAYVFIHHLSPNYKSNLAEIFQRQTPMPVVQVTSGLKLEPNHVYVIPPNTYMSVEDTSLKLVKRTKLDIPYHPIDYFLMSLAEVSDHKGIGVLLSGTATDGTLGLKAIKESGGISFAQDESARHDQMPKNAQEAGYVDFVLSPGRIAQELASLAQHPYKMIPSDHGVIKEEGEIKKVLALVLEQKGVDFFSHYKKSTIYRRVIRRMALNKREAVKDYLKVLRENPGELDALYQDFLINVTTFFREPAFYKALTKTVFPRILKTLKRNDPIRIWVAGCATGEEAYSTAICLTEFLQSKKVLHPIHIFSTDLNAKAIEKARLGIYPKNLVQHITTQRLKRFFSRVNGHYQIVKSIREMCIFSAHDLLKDPPFSHIDLVSCQNVLIYLKPGPQRKIFQAFHYALKPTGFLLMGKSESIGTATDLFRLSPRGSRLYSKIPGPPRQMDFASHLPPAAGKTTLSFRTAGDENDLEKQSDKILLNRYVPASVLVNRDLQIVRFRGSISSYLEPASGKASLSLLKMIKDELLFDVRAALQQAKKSGSVATRESYVPEKKSNRGVIVEVTPVNSGKDTHYLIVFKDALEEISVAKAGKPPKHGGEKAKRERLEQALLTAREQMRSTSEDFEATREELQSANEEILSSNEELQSINEELETSKEELQASNEELTTTNEELQDRNLELRQSRDYAEAIIHTMRGPLIVLNSEMRVRTANKAFYDFFGIHAEQTEGTLIYNLAKGIWLPAALAERLRDGFSNEFDFNDFMVTHTFPQIGSRTLIINMHRIPQTQYNKEALILLSFEDITRYKKAEESLLQTQAQLKLALSAGSVGTWSWNIKTNEVTVSEEENRLYGMRPGENMTAYPEWEKNLHPQDLVAAREAIKRSVEQKIPLDIEFRIVWPDGSTRWIMAKAHTYYDDLGKPDKMIGVNIDVTERRAAIQALEESEKRFHAMSDNAPVMIWMADPDQKITFLNKTWLSYTGKKPEEELGEGWLADIHPEDKNLFLDVYQRSFRDHRDFKIDYRLRRHDGEYRWIMTHGIPRFTGDDHFVGFIGTCIDINDRIDLERQKDDFMSIASHELKTPVTSIKAYAQILHDKFRKANDDVSANMLERLDLQIDKLTGLINTLLDVTKVQSGRMDFAEELFDIEEFVREVSDEMQATLPTHKIIRHVKTEGKVYGDRARIAQVLNNLISNAAKYSPGSSDVIVEASRDGNEYVFSVQDFGIGIPKDMQDKIFGRFFRVSESSGNRVSGLGLGLFISSQIVRQHGGNLWLESQPGKGSKFFFSLPGKNDGQAQ
ncbi:MAG TPA: CheR family methyltransferase [Chryseosolibacter sp.]